jgi:hypothetical protein
LNKVLERREVRRRARAVLEQFEGVKVGLKQE